MKLKILMTISCLCVCSIFYGQDFKNDLTSVKTIDNQIQENKYSSDDVSVTTDRLVLKTSMDNISKKDKQFFSKKEWRKIKKQLLKNKKRISKIEGGIHTYKTIDTIYVDIESYPTRSSLSGW
ncbi:hypothetical protein U6A24_00875 [Aquimarina gracilis]|uniref:Uncharacterized protein n=1 Tax=Aquimarina gracilis TaxID=874422 RepID=A0ABU5ZPF3_9FLAO|nr:hypothetical protein [Aquimarina gracilis]MEB3343989.1 hypothetical protein [Aquimarina gracilis]